MKPIHWLVIGLGTIIIVMWILWPKPDDSKEIELQRKYDSTQSILRVKEIVSVKRQDSIVLKSEHRARKDSIRLRSQNEEIRVLKAKALQATAAIPQAARDLYPQIDSALAAKDSVIAKIEFKSDSLEISLRLEKKAFYSFQLENEYEERIEADMMMACESRNAELQELLNRAKKPKGKTLKDIGKGVGIGVVGWLIGKSL